MKFVVLFAGVVACAAVALATPVETDRTIRVTMNEHPPFVHKEVEDGTAIHSGFLVDLLDILAAKLKFKYTISEPADGRWGTVDPETNEWNGMIGEVVNDAADVAVSSLTVTSRREEDIDFTLPFMSVGLVVMHRKTLVSTPDQKYAMVYPVGSRSQNYTTDVVLNAYKKYDSVRQLANDDSVKVDCMNGGSTESLLSVQTDPLLSKIWNKISSNSERATSSSDGVAKVKNSNGNYAFVMESPSVEYAFKEDACLYQVGDRLAERFFAFAVQKGSALRDEFSQALLTLQEDGTIINLKRKWWTDRRHTSVCY